MTNLAASVMSNVVSRIESKMLSMEDEIRNINSVPVLDVDEQELFNKIKISNVYLYKANGKCLVEAIVSLKEEYICEGINLCIDGYLNADIKVDGKIVETTALILPLEGITTVPRKIKGVCMKARGSVDSMCAELCAGKLWAMEKRCDIFTAKTIFHLGQSHQEGLVDATAMPGIDGVWTDVGVIGAYIWGHNRDTKKARIWNMAGSEICRMDNQWSSGDIVTKCRELDKTKH